MIYTVVIPNVIAMTLLLVLLVSSHSVSGRVMLFDTKIFMLMVIGNTCQCIGEIVAYSIDGIMKPGFHVLNLIVNANLFIVNILFAFLWVVYADYKIFEDIERVKKNSKILILPAVFVILGSLINLFTPVFFRVTQENYYERTALFFIPYLLTYFYLMYGTIFIYKNKNQARKYVFLPAAVFMISILFGSGVQFFFYGVSTIWVGVAIALVGVYVNVQNEVSYTDVLSGLYTRIYMYQYLQNALRKKDSNKRIGGIMLDIDEFKKINDSYGHLTGDDAIRSTGKLFHRVLENGSFAARYGGDEFVILQPVHEDKELLSTLEKIKNAENNFNQSKEKVYFLNFSMGYSILDPETDTVDSFLERLDQAMYEEKKKRKQQKEMLLNKNEESY